MGYNFLIYTFFNLRKSFLLKGNKLEIQYLNMCDDEVESDFEEILRSNSNSKFQSRKFGTNSRIFKQRISKENYLKKTEKMLSSHSSWRHL